MKVSKLHKCLDFNSAVSRTETERTFFTQGPKMVLLQLTVLTALVAAQSLPLRHDPHTICLRCEEICSHGCCIYPVPEEARRHQWNKDCEQEWFTKDGRLLVDGSPSASNSTLSPLVLAVSPANLTVLYCINGLQYKMTCHGSKYQCQATYTVQNTTSKSPSNFATSDTSIRTTSSGLLWLLLFLHLIPGLIIII
ncbi:hypothetical protein MHYP_G00310170 [Metynnis hypsauchen]